ncbi:DUF1566 domain-containing protein [Trinickia soli]|nr:DUF1566 domain-containing protein [Trinickia soli]CAB3644416.1 hypothetical protein LMG24076_00489 [Trinickia soli]
MNHKTDMQAAFDAYYAENWPLCKASIEKGTASEEIVGEREALWDTWQDAWKAALASQSAGVQEGITEKQIADAIKRWFPDRAYQAPFFARSLFAAAPAPVSEPEQAFQARVKPWMLECFGSEIAADTVERNHRFFEEAAELVQACGMTASEAHQLIDYTWGRPVGEKSQEVGGVMVTLAALCLANGLDMHASGETELERISRPDMVIRIRAKQAAKPKHSPLPVAAAEQPSERGEPQDCPHGVDDGACKQCYGEATRGEQGTALLHAAADECMSPDQRNLFDSLGAHDADVYERLFRCVAKRIDASAPTLSGGDGEVAVRAKTVHRRIDALCEAANTAGADYFDASTSMLIATQDLLTALGFPHRMAEPKEYGGSCEDCKWSAMRQPSSTKRLTTKPRTTYAPFSQTENDMKQIPPLAEGEIYLGGFVNANGDVSHTILLPGDNDAATWQEQVDWAKSIGGDLPTRAELVIAYEQHRDQFQQTAYWSNTPDTDSGYSGWAWYQDFYYGRQGSHPQGYRFRARAVRRLSI